MKKTLGFLLLLTILMSNSIIGSSIVLAGTTNEDYQNVNVSEVPPYVTPFGTSKPSSITSWSSNNTITYSGQADNQDLYSNGYFKGAKSISVEIWNTHASKTLTFILYKDGAVDTKIRTFTISAGSGLYTQETGLDSNAKYYFRFEAPCKFNGEITKTS